MQGRRLFRRSDSADTGGLGVACPFMAGKDPQRSAVRRQFFDIEDAQAGLREHFFDDQEAEVRIVFVVNRVELNVF